MSSTLGQFLLKLADDPIEAEAFKKDPVAVSAKHGLSEAHCRALRDGDVESMKQAMGEEFRTDFIIAVHWPSGL